MSHKEVRDQSAAVFFAKLNIKAQMHGTSERAQGTSRYQCTVVDEIPFRGIFEIISGTILCIE